MKLQLKMLYNSGELNVRADGYVKISFRFISLLQITQKLWLLYSC
jgi:hypothetical protein